MPSLCANPKSFGLEPFTVSVDIMAECPAVPEKITDQVLIKSIQSYLGDDSITVRILKKIIRLATNPGDNYLSSVFQVGVTYA